MNTQTYKLTNIQTHKHTNSNHQVPEESIQQCQMVLQGKSRAAIIKELQRTGLDINEAVNNLLSRDDDDGEEEGSDSLVVSGDDVVSWFDSGRWSDYILSNVKFDFIYLSYLSIYVSFCSCVGRLNLCNRNSMLKLHTS
jgi:hypothetical protein